MSEVSRAARGYIKFYRAEKGWGAISSDALPRDRDAWFHVSVIDCSQHLDLLDIEGRPVDFEYEAGHQDSFDFRATRVRLRPPP